MSKILDVWIRTGAAAHLLGISRNALVRMLEAGTYDIRWQRDPGGYRRVFYADVLAYKEKAERERAAAYNA